MRQRIESSRTISTRLNSKEIIYSKAKSQERNLINNIIVKNV